MHKNGKKNGNKWQKITNDCKISEITKYGEKITKMSNNVKKYIYIQMYIPQKRGEKGKTIVKNGKKWPEIANNCKNFRNYWIRWKNENNSQKCIQMYISQKKGNKIPKKMVKNVKDGWKLQIIIKFQSY